MRFDSYFEYHKFISGLCILGYATPFIDYKQDMINSGMTKHIHLYKAKMVIEERDIKIVFMDSDKEVYYTLLKRR